MARQDKGRLVAWCRTARHYKGRCVKGQGTTNIHTQTRTCVTVGETFPSRLSALVSTITYCTPGRREEAMASIVWCGWFCVGVLCWGVVLV